MVYEFDQEGVAKPMGRVFGGRYSMGGRKPGPWCLEG